MTPPREYLVLILGRLEERFEKGVEGQGTKWK